MAKLLFNLFKCNHIHMTKGQEFILLLEIYNVISRFSDFSYVTSFDVTS